MLAKGYSLYTHPLLSYVFDNPKMADCIVIRDQQGWETRNPVD